MSADQSGDQTAAVARHYDSLDAIYRSVWGEHVHHGYWVTGRESAELAVLQLVELVADAAGIHEGSRVCDVGCGYGATARALADRGALVTGLTVSAAQQRYATSASTAAANPQILLGDWLENDLPERSFDAVIAIESVSHMRERARVLAECHRVLVPGGRLVVLDWLAAAQVRDWQRRMLLDPICRDGHLSGLDSLAHYCELMRAAGFGEVTGKDISRHVWRTWPIVVARGARRLGHDRELSRLLLDRSHSERGFVPMALRLMAGYASRGFRYGMLTARRPDAII